jgi:1-acyl-sn-glycerol-3-phosphate acyltransferase
MSQRESVDLPVSKKWLVDGFCWFAKRMVAKQFISLGVQRELLDASPIDDLAPMIVYANHASWWDPITAMLLQTKYFPNRTFYAPIDADALENYRIMAKLGFYGIRMQRFDGASEFLRVTKAILSSNNVTIWITPEGQFADVRDHSLALMPGLSHLATKVPGVTFVPVAFEYAFWNESRPQIFARFGAPIRLPSNRKKGDWNTLLTDALRQTQIELSKSVIARTPEAFEYLIASRPLRLGWYDYGRSWSAWLRGKPFDPRHTA